MNQWDLKVNFRNWRQTRKTARACSAGGQLLLYFWLVEKKAQKFFSQLRGITLKNETISDRVNRKTAQKQKNLVIYSTDEATTNVIHEDRWEGRGGGGGGDAG